ncbi:MAG: hypothetical protein ABH874_01325 [Methanobacteriota archaeon]
MNNKAQLFTLDLLLALVPLTLVLGMSATAIGGVVTQIQEYVYFYSMQRQVSDAADVLIKTPGVPPDWNSTIAPVTVGLAKYNSTEDRIYSHILDSEKIGAMNSDYIKQLLKGYRYFNLSIQSINESVVFSKVLSSGPKASVSNIVVVRRNAFLSNVTNSTEVSITLEAGK